MTRDLFGSDKHVQPPLLRLSLGTVYLSEFLLKDEAAIISAIEGVTQISPFRHLITPGGKKMSVAMSNCGSLGWVSDHAGYRYQAQDPITQLPWPAMPAVLLTLAQKAAALADYENFQPNVCLINRYEAGARMGLHQDRDERNLIAPIVSFSVGLPATFIWGGLERLGKPQRFILKHGDALVWGGPDRLRFHGVAALQSGHHKLTGGYRLNITFRQTGT